MKFSEFLVQHRAEVINRQMEGFVSTEPCTDDLVGIYSEEESPAFPSPTLPGAPRVTVVPGTLRFVPRSEFFSPDPPSGEHSIFAEEFLYKSTCEPVWIDFLQQANSDRNLCLLLDAGEWVTIPKTILTHDDALSPIDVRTMPTEDEPV